MKFEWDEKKAAANFAKHGVSFAAATEVFDDPCRIEKVDDRRDYGEIRKTQWGKRSTPLSHPLPILIAPA